MISDFERASLTNKTFQSVLKKDQDHQGFKPAPKICGEMDTFFITYDDISKSINDLKDKIIRTPEKIPPLIKQLILN